MHGLSRILTLFLAIVVLIGSMGFTLNTHHCMGEVKSMALNKHADNCTGLEMKELADMDCCEDKSASLSLEELKPGKIFSIQQPVFIALATLLYFIPIQTGHVQSTAFDEITESPPQFPDFLSFIQVFRL